MATLGSRRGVVRTRTWWRLDGGFDDGVVDWWKVMTPRVAIERRRKGTNEVGFPNASLFPVGLISKNGNIALSNYMTR